jgi:hypothetical protein
MTMKQEVICTSPVEFKGQRGWSESIPALLY